MKIAILGYGKMGKTIERLAIQKGHEVVLKISNSNQHELTKENLIKADVAIEFSRPETAFHNIAFTLKSGVPIVSGTTAWLEKLDEAKSICKAENGTFFYSSNFSVGVNIFFAMNRHLSSMMATHLQYEVSIEETHHTQKLDYPSGTAITLAEGILENLDRKSRWSGVLKKEGVGTESFPKEAIGIVSNRIDPVPGSHSVKWESEIDAIEISHVAYSREGFAAGALTAAMWIIDKEGVFEMKDMLGF